MADVSRDLGTVVEKYVALTEFLLMQKSSIPSYDFAQYLQMERLKNSQKYSSLVTFNYFDDLYEKSGLDPNSIKSGINRMVHLEHPAPKEEVEKVKKDKKDKKHKAEKMHKEEKKLGRGEDQMEHETACECLGGNGLEVIEVMSGDDMNNTDLYEYEHREEDEFEPDDLFTDTGVSGARAKVKRAKTGCGDKIGFQHRDRIMYFETLQTPITSENLKEIFDINSEAELNSVIQLDDKQFAQWVGKQYDISVTDKHYGKKLVDNATLKDKVHYLLKREAHSLGY